MADFLLRMSGVVFVDLRIPSWDYGLSQEEGWLSDMVVQWLWSAGEIE